MTNEIAALMRMDGQAARRMAAQTDARTNERTDAQRHDAIDSAHRPPKYVYFMDFATHSSSCYIQIH